MNTVPGFSVGRVRYDADRPLALSDVASRHVDLLLQQINFTRGLLSTATSALHSYIDGYVLGWAGPRDEREAACADDQHWCLHGRAIVVIATDSGARCRGPRQWPHHGSCVGGGSDW